MKKHSFEKVIERLLDIYWQRAKRYQKEAWDAKCIERSAAASEWLSVKYLGKHSGMSILYERMMRLGAY